MHGTVTAMITGSVIAHEIRLSLQKFEFQNLIGYQTTVGGDIETVRFP